MFLSCSELDLARVDDPAAEWSVGKTMDVLCVGIFEGKPKLSRCALPSAPWLTTLVQAAPWVCLVCLVLTLPAAEGALIAVPTPASQHQKGLGLALMQLHECRFHACGRVMQARGAAAGLG